MELIHHEMLTMPQKNLPVRIFKKESNKNNVGCEFHWHEQLEFYYVLSGGVHLLCNGKKTWINTGNIAFVNWCEPHKSLEFLDETVHYIIQIDISTLAEDFEILNPFFFSNQKLH